MKFLKKNQVIIYTIALMLVVAGYLNYTTKQENPSVETSMQVEAKDDTQLADIGDARLVSSNDVTSENENTSDNMLNNTNTVNNTSNTTNANDVINTNTAEQTQETNAITADDEYFVKSKLERDTMYSQMIETYEKVLNSANSLETQKQSATQEITKINETKNSIMICENLIQTKGFTNNIVFVNGESISVIIGVKELKTVIKNVRLFGVPEENFKVDLTIARGLDYYTGTVYETFLNEYREIGSVCSGGRYENLAEYYTDKSLPGVGVSIGLTRLFYKLNELNIIKADRKSVADILIIPMVENLEEPIKLATKLRNIGINTEIYLNDKKLKAKFKYADKLEIPYVIVLGEDEINAKEITLKDMKTGSEEKLPIDEQKIKEIIEKN